MKQLLTLLLTLSVALGFGQNGNTFNFVIETTEDKTEYMFSVDDAVDIEVDWGNGSSDTYNGNDTPTHDFGEAGLWTIKVSGQSSSIRFWTGWGCTYAEMLRDILTPVSDGVTGIISTLNMFRGTTVESFTAADFFDDASANVTDMSNMFRGSDFNQDISNWDVSNVTNMMRIFQSSEFNQDIGAWDVSSVTNMRGMFSDSDFNQDIGNWDVSNVENFNLFLFGSELSTENYNKLLIKWSELNLQQDISFDGGSSKYDLGLPQDRRQHIIDEFGWTFTDGGDTGNEVFLLTLYANPQDAGEVEGEGLYYADDNVDVKAMANLGYELISWTDGNDEEVNTDSEFVFTMPAEAVSLTANFALIDYHLTVTIDPEGAGSVSGADTYNMGEEVTLEALPNEGWTFVNWSDGEEVLSADETYVFTMPAADVTLTANYSSTTSVAETNYSVPITIYPNPAQNHITIEGIAGKSTIEVFSITGAKLMRLENQSGSVNLEVSGLENGIYIISINAEKGVVSRKVFIYK